MSLFRTFFKFQSISSTMTPMMIFSVVRYSIR
jgi:hypothetical protein